jgi:hypothetical protein
MTTPITGGGLPDGSDTFTPDTVFTANAVADNTLVPQVRTAQGVNVGTYAIDQPLSLIDQPGGGVVGTKPPPRMPVPSVVSVATGIQITWTGQDDGGLAVGPTWIRTDVEGSTDGINWTVVGSMTSASGGKIIVSSGAYATDTYFRLRAVYSGNDFSVPGALGKGHAGRVNTDDIAADAIKAGQLAVGAVTAVAIADLAVNANAIAANAVTTAAIAAGAVAAGKIGTGAVTAATIAAGAIQAGAIAAGAVTAGTIAAGAVTATEIAAGSITASKILTGAVTADAIAANAITAGAIAAGAIQAGAIAAGAVIAASIATGAVTASAIAAGAIVAGSIAAGAVNAGTIAAGAIDGITITGSTIRTGYPGSSNPAMEMANSGTTYPSRLNAYVASDANPAGAFHAIADSQYPYKHLVMDAASNYMGMDSNSRNTIRGSLRRRASDINSCFEQELQTGLSSDTNGNVTVSFPTSFPGAPVVLANAIQGGFARPCMVVAVYGGGFTLRVGTGVGNLISTAGFSVNYMAFWTNG